MHIKNYISQAHTLTRPIRSHLFVCWHPVLKQRYWLKVNGKMKSIILAAGDHLALGCLHVNKA